MSATTSSVSAHTKAPYYFVPAPSAFPVLLASALFLIITGAAHWINEGGWGSYTTLAGFVLLAFVLQGWFRQAIGESEGGLYSDRIDVSFRWSMSWFIYSEVMFFGAFFGALYWVRLHAVPNLGSLENAVLWPDFKAIWPSAQAGFTASPAGTVESFATMGPWPLPTINTALLLTSGVTLTIAHHALLAGNRTKTFYMLTGFHGFHVFVGTLMLLFITLRLQKGHFTPQRHFGFEGAAWYWHFVDVVWLGLYIVVYWM